MSASRIASKLYQGSLPPTGPELAVAGFSTLVLCAVEFQPPDTDFPGLEVLRCPFDDSFEPLAIEDLIRIHRTASAVAARIRHGKRTLVTCHMGLNRSGLVPALALTELYGVSGHDAIEWVQAERPGALYNHLFQRIIEPIPARASASRTG